MITPVDIHTHQLPRQPGKAIANCYPGTFVPQEGGWYSVGIHPWHIASTSHMQAMQEEKAPCFASDGKAARFEEMLRHPRVLAVGEAGLDKLAKAPMSLQMPVFEYQARLAMEFGKPLVIHLVKAVDELLTLKQSLRPAVPWIIHGFRGKPALAEEFLHHGFYLSFGEKYQEKALRLVPADRLFLETDESSVSIDALYQRAAEARGVSLREFQQTVYENIDKVFFKR